MEGSRTCWKRFSQIGIFVGMFLGLFSVLLWDLRKVHMMSEIIHDDHTSHWMVMGLSEVRHWLSPVDICMLNVTSPDTDLYQYRKRNCSKLTSSRGNVQLHLSCSIGSSIGGKACLPPLNTRTFFSSRLRHPILGNASNALLRTALQEFARLDKPVIFIGDGISKQSTDALLCEILRTDNVQLSGNVGAIDANYTIQWRQNDLRLPIHYMKLTSMNDNGENEAVDIEKRRRKARRKALHNDTFPPGNDTTGNDLTPIKVPLSLTLESIKGRVQDLVERHPNGVVLVVNVGVWYNSRELFRIELPDLLIWMNALSEDHNSTVYFRETAAQHWNHTSSGYFNKEYVEARWDNGTCTPVGDATPGKFTEKKLP